MDIKNCLWYFIRKFRMTEKLEHVLRLALLSGNISITLHTEKQPKMSRKHPGNEPFRKRKKCLSVRLLKFQPIDIKLGWCPPGPVLPHGEKVPL